MITYKLTDKSAGNFLRSQHFMQDINWKINLKPFFAFYMLKAKITLLLHNFIVKNFSAKSVILSAHFLKVYDISEILFYFFIWWGEGGRDFHFYKVLMT